MKIINLEKNKRNFEKKLLAAVKAIKNGDLVVIPTETVYGLAADCFNVKAVNKIFLAKRRPYNDPLIVHISDISHLDLLVEKVDTRVKKIIDIFWPGPLTLVLKKKKQVPDIVTACLDTVAVRMPEEEITRKFISLCEVPLAAPSANIFGRTSSTLLSHIIEDFKNQKDIKYVIYNGKPKYGIESTILDCTSYPFKVLRYGALEIEKIVAKTHFKILETNKITTKKIAPGMYKKHYAPLKNTFVVKNLIEYLRKNKNNQNKIVICSNKTSLNIRKFDKNIMTIPYGDTLKDISKNLYLCLRLADNIEGETILIEPVENKGLGKAIMDRIIKASSGKWIE
ncbi:MAG: L-threonylcarbamoyladenylate synthase [Endomicrobiia bacterium]